MKLHYNPASPYVRKVRVFAIETGLADRIELVPEKVSPVDPNRDVVADNPLGKIPALVTDDGHALYDSRVICEYLDSLHGSTRMFPERGEARWSALRRQALADGMCDAAVITRYETAMRPEELRWPAWIENQMLKFRRAADVMEHEVEALAGTIDIGTITLACALGYLDFRYPDEGWRDTRPNLATWFSAFDERPSMRETAPSELR